jgi:hypothetical protein
MNDDARVRKTRWGFACKCCMQNVIPYDLSQETVECQMMSSSRSPAQPKGTRDAGPVMIGYALIIKLARKRRKIQPQKPDVGNAAMLLLWHTGCVP